MKVEVEVNEDLVVPSVMKDHIEHLRLSINRGVEFIKDAGDDVPIYMLEDLEYERNTLSALIRVHNYFSPPKEAIEE